VYKY